LVHDTISLIVPPDHRWATRKIIEPGELLEEPIILCEETSGTRRIVLSEREKFDIGMDDLSIWKGKKLDLSFLGWNE